jgi:integrase
MAGARKDSRLQTRTARAALKVRHQPYWLNVAEGVALGYRRGRNGGAWYCRVYGGDHRYKQGDLGSADDHLGSNGETILTFYEAQQKARNWAAEQMRAWKIGAPADLTVGEATDSYLEWFRKHRKAVQETEAAIKAHILPKLGDLVVRDLTAKQIRDWHHALAAKARRRRTPLGEAQVYGSKPVTEDEKRARRASANRVLTILKAILNRAFEDELVVDDSPWRKVKPFKGTDEPVIRFLTPAESTRLVNACPTPFRDLVGAALSTGARYSELANAIVSEFNPQTNTVYFSPSKSGRGRHVPLTEEGMKLFKRLTAGRQGKDLIFVRPDGEAWGKNHQVRPLTDACAAAKIDPSVTFHELRHTYASTLAQLGVDLLSISKLLGHADTRITARHYAHLCDASLKAAVAKLPDLGIATEATNVTAIR